MRRTLIAAACAVALFTLACGTDQPNRNGNSNANRNAASGDSRPQPGESHSDAWITTKIKLTLLASDLASGYETEVDSKDGVVTLSGKVDTAEAKAAAEEAAKGTGGVKSVNNEIQVVPDAKRKQVDQADEKINDDLTALMNKDPKLEDLSISANSNAGVVTLSGSVDTQEELLYAAQVMRKTPGVKAVITTAVKVEDEK
jgi:hyperosmotically inducible protein